MIRNGEEYYWRGRLTLYFPSSFAYPVTVTVHREMGSDSMRYRDVVRVGWIDDVRLTDDEMEWLIGFDDDVTNHDSTQAWLEDRRGSR